MKRFRVSLLLILVLIFDRPKTVEPLSQPLRHQIPSSLRLRFRWRKRASLSRVRWRMLAT